MHSAAAKTLSALDRGNDDLGRTKQHGIDGVEITLEALEDLSERSAEIARRATGKRLSKALRVLGRPSHVELRAPAVNDCIVRASHGDDEIGVWGAEGRGAHPIDYALERELQLMRFVQRYF